MRVEDTAAVDAPSMLRPAPVVSGARGAVKRPEQKLCLRKPWPVMARLCSFVFHPPCTLVSVVIGSKSTSTQSSEQY